MSRQTRVSRDKHTFVATKDVFCSISRICRELHPWRLELDFCPNRLTCGHPYRNDACGSSRQCQWLERRTRHWKVPGSSSGRSSGRIFFSRVNFLCWLLFRYPFHPRVTAVARKWSRSLCQKCRWQITHAPYVRGFAWNDMTWCMVVLCTQNACTRATSHGTVKLRRKYTALVDIQKRAIKKASHTFWITRDMNAIESARERRIAAFQKRSRNTKTYRRRTHG